MMRSTSVLVQGMVLFLKIHPIIFLPVLGMTQTASASTCIYDEFNGNSLDLVKWDVFKGHPAVSGGNLPLAEVYPNFELGCCADRGRREN